MLWNGVMSTPRFMTHRWSSRSSSASACAIWSAPSRGGSGMKWYSARAPRRVTLQGAPCARDRVVDARSQRSASGSIRSNAAAVRTSPSAARAAAIDSA